MTDETSLWKASPSQWLNALSFAAASVLAICIVVTASYIPWVSLVLVLPLMHGVWRYLDVRCQVFELTNQRLRITRGVINQKIDEIELYRIKDTQTLRPWWMRITGLATIAVQSSDRTLPHLLIPALPNGMELREQLRQQIEATRDTKRVREMDFDETGSADGELDADVNDTLA